MSTVASTTTPTPCRPTILIDNQTGGPVDIHLSSWDGSPPQSRSKFNTEPPNVMSFPPTAYQCLLQDSAKSVRLFVRAPRIETVGWQIVDVSGSPVGISKFPPVIAFRVTLHGTDSDRKVKINAIPPETIGRWFKTLEPKCPEAKQLLSSV